MASFIVALLFTSFVAGTKARDEWPGRDIVVVAHRGLAAGYPENTLPAFRHALELGVGFIELDLRMTKDGIPVVIHDDTVDRTTDGQGEVGTFTLAEIKKLDAGSSASPDFAGERIPTLKETLELVTSLGGKALLDIKSSTDLDCEKVVRLVEHYNAVNEVIVGARTVEDVKLFRSLNPDIRILGFIPGTRNIKKFVAAGVDIIRLWPRWIRRYPPLVEQAHGLGKPGWTTAGLAGREELAELIKVGVDGILTDLPEVLLALLADIRAEHKKQ
ncbi:MAG: glycerophosphodiester phosphodiesterase [Desulfobacterales bacterium]|nr:glycerophosphodiester phosphodiesterase [Desulfobacterales bacterium]